MNVFERLRDGLQKTRAQIAGIIGAQKGFDEPFYEMLEDALIRADMGVEYTADLLRRLREKIPENGAATPAEGYAVLKSMIADDLAVAETGGDFPGKPWVILVVGVNGVGKTTTIGKMANEFTNAGKKVMLAAADTFRAGAIEQLRIWAQRTRSDFVSQQEMADPASVAFDAMEAAMARGTDVLILDTAGRLHNKANLMAEIEKILRVIRRSAPSAPNEILLVVDATTGQNALKQAAVFHGMLGVTGFIITKLDGTAKGGIAAALVKKFGIPVRKIGVGETLDDLQDFDPKAFVEAMCGDLTAVQ
jgi:fused signal recognition particle receptor